MKASLKKTGAGDQFQIRNGDEQFNKLYTKLRDYKLFEVHEKERETSQAAQNLQLSQRVEQTYRAICNAAKSEGEKGEAVDKSESKKIGNVKVTKKTLIAYLRKRYTARVATKMVCIFEWGNQQLEYKAFYERLEDVLLHPKEKDLSSKTEMD